MGIMSAIKSGASAAGGIGKQALKDGVVSVGNKAAEALSEAAFGTSGRYFGVSRNDMPSSHNDNSSPGVDGNSPAIFRRMSSDLAEIKNNTNAIDRRLLRATDALDQLVGIQRQMQADKKNENTKNTLKDIASSIFGGGAAVGSKAAGSVASAGAKTAATIAEKAGAGIIAEEAPVVAKGAAGIFSKFASGLGTVAKALPLLGDLAQGGIEYYNSGSLARAGGATIGSFGGRLGGGAVGSLVGPLGTVVGQVGGSMAGASMGADLAESIFGGKKEGSPSPQDSVTSAGSQTKQIQELSYTAKTIQFLADTIEFKNKDGTLATVSGIGGGIKAGPSLSSLGEGSYTELNKPKTTKDNIPEGHGPFDLLKRFMNPGSRDSSQHQGIGPADAVEKLWRKFTGKESEENESREATGRGSRSSIRKGKSSGNSDSRKKSPDEAVPFDAKDVAKNLGVSPEDYNTAKEAIAGIEGARYNQMGGAGNKYAGRYQMGPNEIKETANQLGERAPSQQEFLNNPEMQERYFARYTQAHHDYLMKKSEAYRNMDSKGRLGILGYSHNQGSGWGSGKIKGGWQYAETGQSGVDGFGTEGSKYDKAVRKALENQKTQSQPGSGAAGEGLSEQELAKRIQQANPNMSPDECVALAKGAVNSGLSTRDWRKGDQDFVRGTPIATFMERDGSPSDRYDGGKGGIRGNNTTHAAVFDSYKLDKDGNRVGINVYEQYAGRGGAPHLKTYMYNDKRGGEKSAENYYSINDPRGNPLGGKYNPQYAQRQEKKTGMREATPEEIAEFSQQAPAAVKSQSLLDPNPVYAPAPKPVDKPPEKVPAFVEDSIKQKVAKETESKASNTTIDASTTNNNAAAPSKEKDDSGIDPNNPESAAPSTDRLRKLFDETHSPGGD